MRSLGALSTRSLLRRRARYALTAGGAALGVAVLFGVLVTSGATSRALDQAVHGGTGDADVVVHALGAYDASLPGDTESRLAALPDVERTLASLMFRTSVLAVPGGEDVESFGAFGGGDTFGFVTGLPLDRTRAMRDVRLAAGRFFAPGEAEVVIAEPLARRLDATVGQPLLIASPTGRHELRVVGILDDTGAGLADGGNAILTSLPVARSMHGRGDVLTRVDVALTPGTSAGAWIDRHRPAVGEGIGMTESSDLAAGFRRFIEGVNGALQLVAGIALFVGGFLIFLTFSLAVAERVPVYGTLRALGASPKQVRRIVVREAALLGAAASLVGLVLGYGIAAAIISLIGSLLQLDLPSAGLPVGAALLSFGLGVGASAVAAWIPGRRAAAVGPVDAMRRGAFATQRPPRPWLGLGLAVAGLAAALAAPAAPAAQLGAAVVMLLGAVLLVPSVLRPLARVLGAGISRLSRGVSEVAVMHLVKERSRSAYTLALVMVVAALVLSVGASNLAMARTLDHVLDRQLGSDLQVFAPGAFDPTVGDEIAAVPGVARTTEVRFGTTELLDGPDGTSTGLSVIDPATYFDVASFAWLDGDDASARAALARGGHVLLPAPLSDMLRVEVGETVRLRTTAGVQQFTLAATYAQIGEGFGVVAGDPDLERLGRGRPNGYLVAVTDGADLDAVRTGIGRAIGGEHNFTIDDSADVRDQAYAQLRGFFSLAYGILAVAAVIGMLGLANTLVVSVLSRGREIGLLRSVGAVRRQIRAMVVVEGATLALCACVLALPLAWALTAGLITGQRENWGFSVEFLYPWGLVPPLAAVTLLLAGLASLLPARRAGRLEPAVALRFD